MRRPTWVFWTLGAAVLMASLSVLTVAIQAWVVAAGAAGLAVVAFSVYRRLVKRHLGRGQAVVRAETEGSLEGREIASVVRGEEIRGRQDGVDITVFTGLGSEAGVLPWFTLRAERAGEGAAGAPLSEAEAAVVLPWLRRLPVLEVDGRRVLMQFSSWPASREQVEVLLRCLVSVTRELDEAAARRPAARPG